MQQQIEVIIIKKVTAKNYAVTLCLESSAFLHNMAYWTDRDEECVSEAFDTFLEAMDSVFYQSYNFIQNNVIEPKELEFALVYIKCFYEQFKDILEENNDFVKTDFIVHTIVLGNKLLESIELQSMYN